MALPITIPNTFATETSNIPLSDLDANFATVADGVNGIGNGTNALANVAVTGGSINGTIIGGSNAVAGTFSTVTATTANVTTINVTTINATGGGVAPTGSLTMWAGAVASPPTGWLACNGANVSRTTYSALFAVIGTSYGIGDNSTTFGLPNLLNRFPVGAGDTYAIAATGGSANAIVVSHTHTATSTSTVTDPGHAHTLTSGNPTGGQPYQSVGNNANNIVNQSTSTASTGISVGTSTTVASSGSSGTNANLPPYIAVGYIIKT
jgi:microcystin-dependent protein